MTVIGITVIVFHLQVTLTTLGGAQPSSTSLTTQAALAFRKDVPQGPAGSPAGSLNSFTTGNCKKAEKTGSSELLIHTQNYALMVQFLNKQYEQIFKRHWNFFFIPCNKIAPIHFISSNEGKKMYVEI